MNKALLLLFAAAVLCSPAFAQGATVERPNIVLILIDDLGKEWVGACGAREIKTPNIDKLAEGGIRFCNAYSMPQCTPSRVAILTGQYPYRNGWVNHWDVPRWGAGCHFDPAEYPCVTPRRLKKAGYATAAAGKWQIDDFRVEPDALAKAGFDDWCMWTGFETGVPASRERYWNPYVNRKGRGSKTLQGRFGPDVYNDFVLEFIRKHRDEPFFVYYPMALVHTPFVTTPHEPNAKTKLEKHKAMVRYTDFLLGKLVAELDRLELRRKTIIIWTTDNGTVPSITGTLGNRRVRGGKARTTENGINAPFIVNCPGLVPAGKTSDALVDFTDFAPTLAELAGAPVPDDSQVNGRSFADVILGKGDASPREWILAMGGSYKSRAKVSDKGVENESVFRDRVVRDRRYKLFIGRDRKPEKFVDLQNDPEEKNDLTGRESTEALAARRKLEGLISKFPRQDADPKYNANPPRSWDKPVTVKSGEWKSDK